MFRAGSVPTIEKREQGEGGRRRWTVIRKLEGAPLVNFLDPAQKHQTVWVRRLAGRLVVRLNAMQWAILDTRSTAAASTRETQKWQLKPASWGAGPLRVSTFGVLATLRVARLTYRNRAKAGEKSHHTENGVSYRHKWGGFGRFHRYDFRLPSASEGVTWKTAAGGYHNSAAQIVFPAPKLLPDDASAQGVYYTALLLAAPDGGETPFCTSALLHAGARFTRPQLTPIDLAPCLISASEEGAEPGAGAGSDWQFELSVHLLDLEFGYDSAGRGNWEPYLQARNPITFEVRWRYEDGTYSDWVMRPLAYQEAITRGASGFNQWRLSMRARDAMMRLTGVNARLDERFAPLDLHFAQKLGAPIYGAEAVYEIVKTQLGEDEANRINGNEPGDMGDYPAPTLGTLMRYFVPGHPALLSPSSDVGGFLPLRDLAAGGVPTRSGPLFPVPWGQDCAGWMQQFMDLDFAVCFYGFPSAETGGVVSFGSSRPCLIYGLYGGVVRDRPTWRIPDANYEPGDLNALLREVETGDVPEWQINAVRVWNDAGGGGGALPFPAIIQGAARLGGDDPESAEFSWLRELIIQEPKMFLPDAAEALAAQIMTMFKGKTIRRVHLSFAGEERMGWGDKIETDMRSDQRGVTGASPGGASIGDTSPQFLGITGEVFRVVRVSNSYKDVAAGTEGFMTKAACAPYNAATEG